MTDLCQWLNCRRSTYYTPAVQPDERALAAAIEQILLRQGVVVGEPVVRRLLRQLGGTRSVGKVRVQTTDSHQPPPRYPNRLQGLKRCRPDQGWVAAITYLRLGRRFLYLAVIRDAYTRAGRGWALSRSLEQPLTLAALEMALAKATPFSFHSDQGSQDAAWNHSARLLGLGVNLSRSAKASPTPNGLVERFLPTVKEEPVDYSAYRDFEDACQQLRHWLEVV